MRASITLRPQHALDIAALAYAAGDADDPESLQEMIITIDESQQVNYITFGVTNSYVAASRRGTYGEFGGSVKGSGVFSMNARRFSQILRLAAKSSDTTIVLNFTDSDGLEINGQNVGLAYHPMAEYSADRINRIVQPLYDKGGMERDFEGPLPAFDMQLLSKLARASNTADGNRKVMRLTYVDRGRWGYITPFEDSWKFAGVIMEFKI